MLLGRVDPEQTTDINHLRIRGRQEDRMPSRERIIDRYLRHQASVLEYFAGRENFVALDWESGDGWEELCGFLREPVPGVPFPHANKGRYTASPALPHDSI